MRMSVNARKLHFDTGLNYRRHYYGKSPTRTPPQKGHGKIWLGKHIVQWSKNHLCQWLRAFEIFFSHSFSFRHFLAWCLFWGLNDAVSGNHQRLFFVSAFFFRVVPTLVPRTHSAKSKKGMSSCRRHAPVILVGGDGFEPPKAEPADLQSAPFGHSGNHPHAYPFPALRLPFPVKRVQN